MINQLNNNEEDITSMTFGDWKVLGVSKHKKDNRKCFDCICKCGTKRVVLGKSLRHGKSKGCGCGKEKDIIGKRFGKLVVKSTQKNIDSNKTTCVCECDCGKVKKILKSNVKYGSTKSCGCIKCPDLKGQKIGYLTVLEKTDSVGPKQKWLCVCECGTKTRVDTYYLKNDKIRSCGCKKNHLSGEDHPNWNPELTEFDRNNTRSLNRYEQKKWSISVFERDDYTCKLCNSRGCELNAHHLDSWNWCTEGRYDIDNGVTLCSCCHREFHKIYGNGDNTAEEFFEYYLVRRQSY